MLPIRCFTCNRLLGNLYHVKEWNEDKFNSYNIKRFCCKKILKYSINVNDNVKFPSDNHIIQYKNTIECKRFIIPR